MSHNKSRPEDAAEDVASVTRESASSCSIALFFDFGLLPRVFGDEDASGGSRSDDGVIVTPEKLIVGGRGLFTSREAQ